VDGEWRNGQRAVRLRDGEEMEEISLEARRTADRLGERF